MAPPDLLALLQSRTAHLVGEQLRSTSLVIGHLRPLIADAHAHGHSHAAIHARLLAGGLPISWRNYRACLARWRQRAAADSPSPAAASPSTQDRPVPAALQAGATPVTSPSSPTPVRDALRGAQQVATRDYAQVARDLHRHKPVP